STRSTCRCAWWRSCRRRRGTERPGPRGRAPRGTGDGHARECEVRGGRSTESSPLGGMGRERMETMVDADLKIDGVPGESQSKNYKEQIEVISFSHGIHQPAAMAASTAGGASTGRSEHSDFSIVKQLDKASPVLAMKCSDGSHIKEATLTLVRSG